MNGKATHVQDRLLELTYGELSADDARAVETHVEECPSCRQALDEIRGVRRVMAKLSQPPAPQEKLESLLAYAEQAARRASAGPVPKVRGWSKWLVPVGGFAALVAFGIVAHEVSKGSALMEDPAEHVLRERLGAVGTPPVAAVENPADQLLGDKLEAAPPLPEAAATVPPAAVAKEQSVRELKRADPRAEADRAQKNDAAPAKKKGFALSEEWPADAEKGRAGERSPSEPSSPPALGGGELQTGRKAGGIGYGASVGAVPPEERSADTAAPEGKSMRPSQAPASAPPSEPARSPSQRSAPAEVRARSDDAYAERAAAPAARAEIAREAVEVDVTRARAEALSRQALDANRAGARQREVEYLRQALATGVRDPAMVTHLLLRLCDAQLALGNVADGEAACERVVREFPSTSAANVATHRLGESRVGRAKAQPPPPATAAPAESR